MKLNTAKKLTAGALALSMMFAMATPAFAATNAEESPNGGTGSFTMTKVYKVLNPNTTSPSESFTFTVKAVTDGRKTTTFGNGNELKFTTENAMTASTVEGAKEEITIPLGEEGLNITAPGVYYYTIEETDNGTQGVDYDSALTMKVTAGYKEDTDTSLSYWVALVRKADATETNGKYTKADKVGQDEAFVNVYKAGTLTIGKTVTGLEGNHNQLFDFTLTLHGKPDTQITYTLPGDSQTAQEAVVNEQGIATITGIQLKHGQTWSLGNIPYDMTYEITETNATDYEVSVSVDGGNSTALTNTDGSATYNDAKIDAAAESVQFTNHKGGTVDTGVILDNAPYILMLAVVAGGAMTLVIKKRREEE